MSDEGASLAFLERAISNVNDNIQMVGNAVVAVHQQVETVAQLQDDTRKGLDKLSDDFAEFVAEYRRKTEWQLAQSRIVEVRQKFETEFGHYDIVRRSVTGMLQAADLGIVRNEAMKTRSEDFLITCPKYWLAAAMAAMVGWLTDQRSVAEHALDEALKRHDGKTSLFFALTCRRARRTEACIRWLERYFQNQNPSEMQREVAVMLDAVVNGAFGGAAMDKCLTVVDSWLDELEELARFSDEQRQRWAKALDVKRPRIGDTEYPSLRAYSPTWPALDASLSAARRNQVVYDFFDALFTGEIEAPLTLESTIDFILTTLVTEFDEAELPLRRELTKLELIIAEEGDKATAQDRYDSEVEALREVVNFGAILTNAAMYPEQSGTTRATQRYAVSRSRHWIVDAFNDLVARERAKIPQEIEIKAGSWQGKSKDGTNEADLVRDCERHYANRIEQAVNALTMEAKDFILPGIGGLIALFIAIKLSWIIGVLGIAGVAVFAYFKYQEREKQKVVVREQLEKERGTATKMLRATLAELVDFRRDLFAEDAKATKVSTLLDSISSSQLIISGRDTARAVLH